MQFGFVSATFASQIPGRFESQPGGQSSQIFELKQVQSVCKIVSVSGVLLRSRQISCDILGLPKESGMLPDSFYDFGLFREQQLGPVLSGGHRFEVSRFALVVKDRIEKRGNGLEHFRSAYRWARFLNPLKLNDKKNRCDALLTLL
jgi:hypothetical protein